MSRARELSRLGNINVLSGDDINSEVGIASTVPRSTLDVRGELQVGTGIQVGPAGVITATSFDGALGGNIVAAACTFTTGTFTGNVTIGGTLTYEDVTNVDALGIVTARAGVNVSGGQLAVGVAYSVGAAGVATAAGFVGPLTGAVTGTTGSFSSNLTVGSGITFGSAGVATFSGTSDVHLLDSVKLNLGDGADLSIYHNGSNGYSYIEDTGSGRLVVKTSYFEIDNEAGNEAILEGIADGAVKAYYNGSLKLETTSGGIKVTGNDGVTIEGAQDNSADLFFNADGGDDNDDKWYLGAYAGGPFKLLNYASGSWETNIEANGNGNVELYFNDSKKLETTNDGTVTTGIGTFSGGYLDIRTGSSINTNVTGGSASGTLHKNTTSGEFAVVSGGTGGNNYLSFYTSASAAPTEKLRITHDGYIQLYGTAAGITSAYWNASANRLYFNDNSYAVFGDSADLQIFHDGSHSQIMDTGTGNLYISGNTNVSIDKYSGEEMANFNVDGSVQLYYNNSEKFVTTNDGVVISGMTTSVGVAYTGLLREAFAKTGGKLSDNTNIDLEDGMVHYFTTTESTTSTPNLRWNSSFSLANKMNVNDAITVTIITTAAAAGYSANLTIDGNAVTEQWVGGDAPSEGGSDGYDIYTYNILKIGTGTGDSGFFVIGNLVNAT